MKVKLLTAEHHEARKTNQGQHRFYSESLLAKQCIRVLHYTLILNYTPILVKYEFCQVKLTILLLKQNSDSSSLLLLQRTWTVAFSIENGCKCEGSLLYILSDSSRPFPRLQLDIKDV